MESLRDYERYMDVFGFPEILPAEGLQKCTHARVAGTCNSRRSSALLESQTGQRYAALLGSGKVMFKKSSALARSTVPTFPQASRSARCALEFLG